VPQVAAGVYTIWRDSELVYVGMSGRKLTAEGIAAERAAESRKKGLRSRLGGPHAGPDRAVVAPGRARAPGPGQLDRPMGVVSARAPGGGNRPAGE
jgi:hypothetical protein